MGIINLTPDSFSDGGKYLDPKKSLEKCQELIAKGVQIIDFGGQATNPKSSQSLPLSSEEELKRVYQHIKLARSQCPSRILFSIDTYHPHVAYSLAREGLVDIINDIFAAKKVEKIQGKHATTAHVAAQFKCSLVIMYSGNLNFTNTNLPLIPAFQTQFIPGDFNRFLKTIWGHSHTLEPLSPLLHFFEERTTFCKKVGVRNLIYDPGIGYGLFGKNFFDILFLLSGCCLKALSKLDYPLLIGVSRKSFVSDLIPELPLNERDPISKEIEQHCLNYGTQIIRTHQTLENSPIYPPSLMDAKNGFL